MNKMLNILAALGLGLAAAQAQAVDVGNPERGAKLAAELGCGSCHGPDGNSATPQFPRIAGQHADYLAIAIKDYRSGKRNNALMNGQASSLSDEAIEDLAAHYARQEGPLHTKEAGRFD
jgi:cytochrome c553